MRKSKAVTLASVAALVAIGFAQAARATTNYLTRLSPMAGVPWSSSASSSFDWSNWTYSDNTLTNGGTSTRTWVMPLPLNASTSVGSTMNAATGIYAYADLVGGTLTKSCMQLVVNNSDGSRFAATSPACTLYEGLMTSGSVPVALPGNLKDFNAYENVTVPPGGKFKYASFSMVYP